jgi:GNAT superfamily N-acetyltransferase
MSASHSSIRPIELASYLEAHVEGFRGPLQLTKFDQGQSNPTFLVSSDSGRYVLRRKPPGELLASAHAVDLEYKVLRALAETDVPVPQAIHLCEDESIIGSIFYLMSFEDGRIFWDPALPRPPADESLARPDVRRLLGGWGRVGDRAVIAEEGETPVGAAWYRSWTESDHTYGFVDAETPELGIAVQPSHRSRGVGRPLIHALIRVAADDEVRALSLSVDPSNFARRPCESEGFEKVGESGTS